MKAKMCQNSLQMQIFLIYSLTANDNNTIVVAKYKTLTRKMQHDDFIVMLMKNRYSNIIVNQHFSFT